MVLTMSETESDELVELMPQFFMVDDIADDDFDPKIPPTSGQEYLRRVQLEAKQCPKVVVADIDSNLFRKNQTFRIKPSSDIHVAPCGFAPTLQWQLAQIAKFSQVRQKFIRYIADAAARNANGTTEVGCSEKPLPDREDAQAWCQLCFGKFMVPTTSAVPSANGEHARVSRSSRVVSSKSSGGTPPLLSVVSRMDQPMVVDVLGYHVNWFEAVGFSDELGHWLYALLVLLEKPLVPEVCYLLRRLARNCSTLRASLESADDPVLIPMNLFICLVAMYFDQGDLADKT